MQTTVSIMKDWIKQNEMKINPKKSGILKIMNKKGMCKGIKMN